MCWFYSIQNWDWSIEPSAELEDTNQSILQIVINLQMSEQEEVEPGIDALGT